MGWKKLFGKLMTGWVEMKVATNACVRSVCRLRATPMGVAKNGLSNAILQP